MNTIEIPEIYLTAIEQALEADGVTVSTLKVKAVLSLLPGDKQDFISCQFYVREYKRGNKRVSKLTQLLNAANKALETLVAGSDEHEQLHSAICLFDKPTVNEDEF